MIQLGGTVFDRTAQMLRDGAGAQIALRAQSLRVLNVLVEAQGSLVSKEQLFKDVWGSVAVTDDSLVQCIREIRNAIGDVAHQILKTEARRGYRLVFEIARVNQTERRVGSVQVGVVSNQPSPPEQLAAPDGQTIPAIAVMAFTSMDGDERSERLAMTFAGDLITELSRQKSLRVIGRFASFSLRGQPLSSAEVCKKLNARYLVSGQVQFSEAAIVWSLEMMDGHSDEVVWSERKQVKFSEIESETSSLFWRMASAINANMLMFTFRKSFAAAPESLNAFDLSTRVFATLQRFTVDSTREAQRLAALAVEAYPQYEKAWRALAHSHVWDMDFCHTGQWSSANIAQPLKEIHRAIELDSSQPAAFNVLSQLLIDNGQQQEALLAAAQALELGPNDQYAMHLRCIVLFFSGQLMESRVASERLIALTPIRQSLYLYVYGRTLLALGEWEPAIRELLESVTASPGNTQARMALVVALEEAGEHAAASEHFKTLLTHTNGFDEGYFGRRWSAIPEIRDRFVKALLRHGMRHAGAGHVAAGDGL
jgi:TolB-like protein/Flp pilus assembly protein TadD